MWVLPIGICNTKRSIIDEENSSLDETLTAIVNFVCLQALLLCMLVLPGALGTVVDQSDAGFTF